MVGADKRSGKSNETVTFESRACTDGRSAEMWSGLVWSGASNSFQHQCLDWILMTSRLNGLVGYCATRLREMG